MTEKKNNPPMKIPPMLSIDSYINRLGEFYHADDILDVISLATKQKLYVPESFQYMYEATIYYNACNKPLFDLKYHYENLYTLLTEKS